VLNLASNNFGEFVLAAGWRSKYDNDSAPWVGPEGRKQHEKPGKPEGIIAIANAIPDMGAMTSLNLSSNAIGGYHRYAKEFTPTPEGTYI
jgi:hypothetical protein